MTPPTVVLREFFDEIHLLSCELKKLSASAQGNVLNATQSFLETLRQRPQTVPSIAKARRTSRQNTQVIADRLAELGWIEFVSNPRHKKSELVRLTEKGVAQLKASAQAEIRMLSEIAADIPAQELRAALEFLRRLHSMLPGVGGASRDSESENSRLGQPETAEVASQEDFGRHEPVSLEVEQNARDTQKAPDEEPLPWNLL